MCSTEAFVYATRSQIENINILMSENCGTPLFIVRYISNLYSNWDRSDSEQVNVFFLDVYHFSFVTCM